MDLDLDRKMLLRASLAQQDQIVGLPKSHASRGTPPCWTLVLNHGIDHTNSCTLHGQCRGVPLSGCRRPFFFQSISVQHHSRAMHVHVMGCCSNNPRRLHAPYEVIQRSSPPDCLLLSSNHCPHELTASLLWCQVMQA